MTYYRFSCAAFSETGGRENNEDNFYLCHTWREPSDGDGPFFTAAAAEHQALFAVFDGMGGEADGEYASWQAASTLHTFADRLLAAEPGALGGLISEFLNTATDRIRARAAESGVRSGSTASILLCRDDGIYMWNVGDSPVFLLHEGTLEQISTDDTEYERLLRSGEAKPGEEWALRQRHKLTQHLGIGTDEMLLSPHSVRFPTRMGDRYLICSDGVTEVLEPDGLRKLLDADAPPPVVARSLAQAVRSSPDNISAIVIQAERERRLRIFARPERQETER